MQYLLLLLCVASVLFGQSENGSVVGVLYDAATGKPISGGTVSVQGHQGLKAQAGTDGTFRLDLAPGTYSLVMDAPNYVTTVVQGVPVKAGEAVEASAVLPLTGSGTTLDVVEKLSAVSATAEAALIERKLAPYVSDAISREELRSGTASNAAAALEKVTGVSIVDNGYVYVRGLGERYSATMLNNAMIPTTEPEKRVVPLDLFPAALIESVRVLKTYSPDLPGEFSGGLVQMNTIEFPSTRILRVSTNFGYNTRTTFDRFNTFSGGSGDFFGFGKSGRALPSAIPSDARLFPGSFSEEEFTRFGRSFANDWQPSAMDSMRPVQSYSVVAGGTFGRFGIVGAFTFNNRPQRYDESRSYYRNAGEGQPFAFTRYPDFRDNTESARLGGVLNVAIRLTPANKLVFRNTLTRDSDKETRLLSGYAGTIDSFVQSERLRWIERGILSSSVEGEHTLGLIGSIFRWQFTYSSSTRDEPDLRETIRGLGDDGNYYFLARPESGLRFFNDLNDGIYEPQVELGKPFYRGMLSGIFKVGFRATLRNRDFEARRFRFIPGFAISPSDLLLPSNQLFAPENIGGDKFTIRELTRGTDRYDASMNVYGGYAMSDFAIGTKWRFVAGVRIEDADIQVRTVDPLVPGAVPAVASLTNRDPLPSVNAIYALTPRQNLRVGYSNTLSRPDFRELSPFEFTNVVGGFNTVGNPNLRRSKIHNYDVRWEWFRGGNNLLAVSYFVKRFKDPIEVTIQAVADIRQSYLNADSARNQGVELEFRHNLGFLGRQWRQFAVQSNFTAVDSNVVLPRGEELLLTSTNRPLVGQSRYINNFIAEWVRPDLRSQAKFLLNSVSRRITDVGTFGLPDIYQERNTFLDFVYQYDVRENGAWTMRFSAENLGDNLYHWTQGGNSQRMFRTGRTFTVGTAISIF